MEKHEMLPKQWTHYHVVDLSALVQWSSSSPTGTVILTSILSLHCLIYCLQKQEAQEKIHFKQTTGINNKKKKKRKNELRLVYCKTLSASLHELVIDKNGSVITLTP